MMIMPVVCGKQEGKREKVEKEKNAGQRKKIFRYLRKKIFEDRKRLESPGKNSQMTLKLDPNNPKS